MKQTRKLTLSVAVCAALSAAVAHAGGFEKATTWSGHYAAMAGAATSIVNDSEALFFNPAGLSALRGPNVSLNFSPTFSKFEGPVVRNNTALEGNREFSPIFGATAGYGLNEKWGVGLGVYVSGGTKAVFENVDYTSISSNFDNLKPTVKSDLSVVEAALGTGFEVLPGLRLGGAWRVLMVDAELSSATASAASLQSVEIKDLSDTRFNGFKAGIQYSPKDSHWGVGASWRSQVKFIAKGKSSGKIELGTVAANAFDLTGGDATVANTFPQQVSGGFFFDVVPQKLRLIAEYTWSQYSKNKDLEISGGLTFPTTFPSPLLAGRTSAIPSIAQNWMDQHNARFAGEYRLTDPLALRAGYVLTTAVVPRSAARATFSSPGLGHTITAGAGYRFTDHLSVNGAGEYSFASGTVNGQGPTEGDYSTNAWVLHAGVTLDM